jgi:hypothetical protein
MPKHLLIAAAATALTITGFAASSPTPAKASWAETPQGNPVQTGTNRSLWRSERAERHGRAYRTPGYSAYGSYYGDAPAFGAYTRGYPGYAPYGYDGGYADGYYRY